MWFGTRLCNIPELTGYIVKEKVRCGKKNCRCVTKDKRHEAFYLYYRAYGLFGKKLRKKYVRKSDLARLQRKLSTFKGFVYLNKLELEPKDLLDFCDRHPNLSGESLWVKAYEEFGPSRHAEKWANFRGEV